MLKLSLGHGLDGLEPTHECLNAERSLLLNVETEAIFAVDPTSHLCVVLHFLICILGETQDFKITYHGFTVRG